MPTLCFVLAKPVVENLKQFLTFFPYKFVKHLECLGRQAFHRHRVSFETSLSLTFLLQVEINGVDEVIDHVAKSLEPNWVKW